jgi:uroporphyrin-III C-methyltransferase/precorrin-2 dehydrogenase/sirohydrochlorin ferrochelatase
LKLAGLRTLVVGGGGVAERKITELLAADARLTVVAPESTSTITKLAREGRLELHARTFTTDDLAEVWLVIAATNDPEVQSAVARAAGARHVFVVAVDDVPNATAYSAALVRRAPYTIAISSNGETPALSRLLREILEQVLPDEGWVEAAKALRARWRAEGTPMSSRFPELVRMFQERAGKG